MAGSSDVIHGVDFNQLLKTGASPAAVLEATLQSYSTTGFQATQFSHARALVQEAIYHRQTGDKVFLSYTSNLISCGLRELLAYLARNKLVDGFISTAGGVEEDIIKCLGKTLIGDFHLEGKALRQQGMNRVGNLLVPNNNYCDFENFFMPVLRSLHQDQRACRWTSCTTPSEIIARVGAAMTYLPRHEESLVYQCYANNIPLFCPAFTDGSMGDMIYFYNFSKKGLVVDPLPDVSKLRSLRNSDPARNICLVLGGGLPKHQLLRHVPASRVLMVTTGMEVDGCVSSCDVGSDRTCGLVTPSAHVVRLHAEATLVAPLLFAAVQAR